MALKEHFAVRVGDNYLIHFPLRRMDILITEDLWRRLQAFELGGSADADLVGYLEENHLLAEGREQPPDDAGRFEPSGVTLFPTSDCNLRCVYCYGSAGSVVANLSWARAQAAIDFVVHNAKDRRVQLGFHGGGEPFVVFKFVKRCVEYFRAQAEARNLKPYVTSATNGVFGESQLKWIVKHFNHLNLSWDGPKDVQDRQRPDRRGKGTYERVIRTVEYLRASGFSFGVRATITADSVKRMREMVEFFHERGIRKVHFEPLFFCGRCTRTNWSAPDGNIFVAEYERAAARARELGVALYYSGSRPGCVTNSFCGAAGKNFCVTPEGDISSCYEVSLASDPRSHTFFYGRVNAHGVEIFPDRLEKLRRKTVDANSSCAGCFIKWSCGGECLAKYNGNMPNLSRCNINRELSLFEILQRMGVTAK